MKNELQLTFPALALLSEHAFELELHTGILVPVVDRQVKHWVLSTEVNKGRLTTVENELLRIFPALVLC